MRAAALLALLLAAACGRVPAGPEDVLFHYEKSVDGVSRDSNFDGPPLRARLGGGQLLPGLEEALRSMRPGEERTIALPPEKAYGPRDPKKVESMRVEDFGAMASQLAPGARIYGTRAGRSEKATVEKVEGGRVTLDFNPPDAGKTITFRLRLVSRRPAGADPAP